jgi:hypothetical protein
MSAQRYVSTSFWDDAWIQELDSDAKLLYMYLLTCPLANIAGVYKITARRISFDTGISVDLAGAILKEFEAKGKAAFFEEYIILPNWPKYQKLSSKDTRAGIDRVLAELPDDVLLALKRLNYQYDDIPIGSPTGPHKAPHRPPIGGHQSASPTSTLNSYSTPIPIPSGQQAGEDEQRPETTAKPARSPADVKIQDELKRAGVVYSTHDLARIGARLAEKQLDECFVAYAVERAKKSPGTKNWHGLLKKGLLEYDDWIEEYRPKEPREKAASPFAEKPAACPKCGEPITKYDLFEGEARCTACGTDFTWERDFGYWQAVPVEDSA